MAPSTWPRSSRPIWWPRGCVTSASQPARPTTTRSASASTARSSRSAGARPSTAGTSPPSASSRPRSTPGSSTTTTADGTTATTCVGALRIRSSTSTGGTRQHDHQPQGPSVTSTLSPEGLDSLVMGGCTVAPASDDNGYVGTDTSGFCAKVDLSIGISGKCIYPPNPSAACPGVPTNVGNLAAVAGATFNQQSTPPLPLLAAGASQAYTFTVMLDPSATNADQGLTASMTMTWNQA